MLDMIEANWPLVVAAVLLGLLIAWYVFHASRKTRVSSATKDVLEEGAAPASRNQALIDSAPSASTGAAFQPQSAPEVASHDRVDNATVKTAPVETVAVETVAVEAVAPAASSSDGDDLTRIKGVGPKLARMLSEMGVTSFAQLAKWDDAEINRIDAQLGRFQGRIERDNWVEQARLLGEDDLEGYKAKFGSLE